jgi:hypothetical protein
MWIKKSPVEIIWGRRLRLLFAASLNVFLGVSLLYILVRLFGFLGVLPRSPVSGYICCAVIAVILPAAFWADGRAGRKSKNTLVCDRCNRVKLADGQLTCQCSGHYRTLDEMKWIDPAPARTARQSA